MFSNNSLRGSAPTPRNQAAERISRPVLNIYIGTKASLAGMWIARYELPYLNRADQERVGSLYLDLETVSSDIDSAHAATSDASPFFKYTLKFPDLGGYMETLTPQQKQWLQISSPVNTRLPNYAAMGAGGIRQNGHGAIVYNVATIAQQIETLINNISAVDSAGHAPDAELITVNIVCFLGGGTGSGAIPATAAIARHILRQQRRQGNIFIYGMLPVNVGNISPERQTIQKSNSLAALLELEALLLKGEDKSQQFLFEVGNMQIRIPENIVDEIFLFDDTQLGDQVDQISQLVAMAIAMRMQNLTGIGKREQALRPDLTALQEHDDGGLITNLGSVCPLEVVFPQRDLATGFARHRAEALLRQILTDVPLDYKEEDLLRNQTIPARRVPEQFRITDRERRAAPEPRRWGGSEILQSLDRYSTVIEQTFGEQRDDALRDQMATLNTVTQQPTWTRSLPRLRAVLTLYAEEYQKVKELTFASNPTISRMGPDQLNAENERKRKAYYQQAAQEEFQRHRITATNAVADAMLHEIEKRLRMLDVMESSLRYTQQRWEAEHYESPEMQGMLTQEHPYRHNLFDRSAIPEAEAIDQLDNAVTQGELDRILKTAMTNIAAALNGDERAARETASNEANQLMANMTEAYRFHLTQMRMLEAIKIAYPRDKARQDAALVNHMRWMSVQSRSTLRHDPSLWGDQGHRQLEVRAHIAVDYEDESERQSVERARQAVGGFGERGIGYIPPGEVMPSNDRARMQLLFSHHGISMSAVPFLADAAGGCVKSLKDRQRMWEAQGGLPVFTCNAMQEMVTNPGVFFDPAYERSRTGGTVPPASGVGGDAMPGTGAVATVTQPRNLIDRVERRARS